MFGTGFDPYFKGGGQTKSTNRGDGETQKEGEGQRNAQGWRGGGQGNERGETHKE